MTSFGRWIDSHRGRVLLPVGAVHGGEPEVNLDEGVAPRVSGPHPCDRLADRTYGVRYCANCNGVATGGEASVAVASAEHLEVWDGFFDAAEERVEVVRHTEVMPDDSMLIFPRSVGFLNSASHRCL